MAMMAGAILAVLAVTTVLVGAGGGVTLLGIVTRPANPTFGYYPSTWCHSPQGHRIRPMMSGRHVWTITTTCVATMIQLMWARRQRIGSHQCMSEARAVAHLLRARPMVHLAMASRLEAMVR